jgi:DNA-binding CsgD family transcriptional regulator
VVLDLIITGHWEQAEQISAQCLEMAASANGSELLRQTFLTDLGLLAACRGDLEIARRYFAEVTAWCKPRGLNLLLRFANRIAVRIALAEGDYEAAYQAAVRISPPGQFPRKYIQVGDDMLDMIEALVRTGRLEEARAHVAEAVRLNLAEVSPRVAALILAASAMTAPDSEAGALYEAAVGHPGITEFPFEHARILLAQGMWLRRSRRHTEARVPLSLAIAIFQRLGARPWAERAQAELRTAAVSTHQAAGEASPLSAQERRIADLAANGETSKEIAAKLSLSPRTVDVHLRRTFRKLGITRRGGLSKALRDFDAATEVSPTA